MIRALAMAILFAAPAAATNYTITITTGGPSSLSSISYSSGTTAYSCPSSCTASFQSGSTVTMTETAASTTVFVGWTGTDGCGTNAQTCAVTMGSAKAVTATFNPKMQLAVYGKGLGTVSGTSGLINCGSLNGCIGSGAQTYNYAKGTTVVLTETAGSSSTFVGWTGDAGCATASTCTVTMNGYENIIATFTSVGPFTLAVKVVGSGVVTSSNPVTGINCGSRCAVAFSSGTSISLSTHAASGYYFAGWANGGCSGKTPCVVIASTTYQGLGGSFSPAAFFYPTP